MLPTSLLGALLALTTAAGAGRPPLTDETAPPRFGSELAGVKLGSGRRILEGRFPRLRGRLLATGELAFEACDPERRAAITYFAEPLTPEHVTKIEVRRGEDAAACRSASGGALPEIGVAAAAQSGIAVGDPAARALARYGEPDHRETRPDGDDVVWYRSSGRGHEPRIRNLLLVVVLRDRKVHALTLTGDVPGLEATRSPNAAR